MTEQHRAVAPPIIESIPTELLDRTQWVCWALEWRTDKWTKVPYTPHTTSKARSNAASSWRSFQAAISCYRERPDFFDGIGFMFSKDDPYVGGDIDHCITDGVIRPDALALLPNTYAEISPSGDGVKFIARATGDYGRKTVKGELYSKGRFFTITGAVLAGHERITDCQDAVDTFAASLGGPARVVRAGTPGSGSRAEKAASIPKEEWEAGRELLRTQINRLLARLRGSAVSRKTGTDDTQLGMLIREDYRGFHERWSNSGIVRSDGSLDSSQIRACMASNIRSRGFTFPEYVALFYHFFGVECMAKWGTRQGFREEAASLWFYGRSPRAGEVAPAPPPVVRRGRGSDHAALRARAYAVILSYRVGSDAILTLRDLSSDMHISIRAAANLVGELAAAGMIGKRKNGQYGGLIVSFPDMHNEEKTTPDAAHTNGVNPHETIPPMSAGGEKNDYAPDMHNAGAIYRDNAQPDAPNASTDDMPMSAEQDDEPPFSDMHNETSEGAQSTASESVEAALCMSDDERGETAPYIYIESISTQSVYTPASCMSEKRVSIADAVSAAFDDLPHDRTLPTGELKRWPITAQRVVAYVEDCYAAQHWKAEAIRYWVGKIRKRRRSQPFDELRGMRREELEARATSARKRIATAERKAVTSPMPELREWYAKEAARLSGYQALLAWEQGERDAKDAARIEKDGYSPGEQNEMLELVEKERKAQSVSSPTALGLIGRLKARKVND